MRKIKHDSLVHAIGIVLVGIGINLLLSALVTALGVPLYLDSIGTILTAAVAGIVPGMIVGFLTNLFLSTASGLAAYYGILNVAIAIVAAYFSKRGAFLHWKGRILAFFSFFMIGGVLGGAITYAIYGALGVNTSVGLFLIDVYQKMGAQYGLALIFTEITIDIVDKLVVVAIVCILLKHYPKRLAGAFEYSWRYDHSGSGENTHYVNSVSHKWTIIVGLSLLLMSLFTIGITLSCSIHLMLTERGKTAQAIANQVATYLDGDAIENQLEKGEKAQGYTETKEKLQKVMDSSSQDIRFIYVYAVKPDGVYAVYDTDVAEMKGVSAGTRITNDPDLFNRIDEFLKGGEVKPGSGNLSVDTAVSAYTPVYDSQGNTKAYACVDISAKKFWSYLLELVGNEVTALIAISLILMIISIYVANKQFVRPLKDIIHNSELLRSVPTEQWLDSEEWKSQSQVHTGDEIEELYRTVRDMNRQISENVKKGIEIESANLAKTQFLARMSHDMRTPLNGILGLTYIMEEEASIEEIKSEIPKLREAGKFLLQLVNDVLDINKIESGEI